MSFANACAIALIKFYRSHLTSLKGYSCAWGVASKRPTCSAVGLRAFRRAGVWKGMALLGRQFDRCAIACSELRPSGEDAGTYRRFRPGAHRAQTGSIDCDPGCDAGCFKSGPGCDVFDFGSARDRRCWTGLCDFVYCCDAPCGSDEKKAARKESRAAKARHRQESRQSRRELRRSGPSAD